MVDISRFGKMLKFEKSNLSLLDKEKELFINTIDLIDECIDRSAFIKEEMGLDLIVYETALFNVIENLILIKYGQLKLDVILWYIYGNTNEPMIIQEDDKEDEYIYIKSSLELWDFLKSFKDITEDK